MAAGKVCTGFSKPYVARYSAAGGLITYTGCRKLARGVEVSIDPNTSDDNKFYADNVQAESSSGAFTGGTATITVDGLFVDAERFIMGLPEPGADGFMAYGDTQQAPDMGYGCIARYMSGGVTTYTPIVLAKVKFGQPKTSAKTQEDTIDWQTQELTATIMRGEDANHNWKYVGADYSTEEDAEVALKKKLGVNSFAITQNLTNVTSSLTDTIVDEGASLTAVLTVSSGYSLSTPVVTMGGIDITATAWDSDTNTISIASVTGAVVITATAAAIYSITKNLTNVSASPTDSTAVAGSAVEITLTALNSMNMKSVTVTMGGVDITSSAWNSGTSKVAIASVTGNIVIMARAAYDTYTLTITNILTDGYLTVSYSDSNGDVQTATLNHADSGQAAEIDIAEDSPVSLSTDLGASTEWKLGTSTIGTGATCSFTMPSADSGFKAGNNAGTNERTITDSSGGMSGFATTDFTVA